MKRLVMAFGASVTLIFAVSAKTCNWIGGSGDWDVPENWEDGAKPGADDIANFPATEKITVPSIGTVRDVWPPGFSAKVTWRQQNGGLVLSVPPIVPTELPGSAAWTLRIEMEDGIR